MMQPYCNILAMRRLNPLSEDCRNKTINKIESPLWVAYKLAYLCTIDIGRMRTNMELLSPCNWSHYCRPRKLMIRRVSKCAQIPLLARNVNDNDIIRLRIYWI